MAGWALPLISCCLLLSKQVAGGNHTQTDALTTTESTTATRSTTVTSDQFSDYQHGGATSVCRETVAVPTPDNVGRNEESHAVTHVDSIGTCREFCDEIKPCYGFEFTRNNPEIHYGNCETERADAHAAAPGFMGLGVRRLVSGSESGIGIGIWFTLALTRRGRRIWIVPILRFKMSNDTKFDCYNKTSTYSSSDSAKPSVVAGLRIANLKAADILANQSLLNLTQNLSSLVMSHINTSVVTLTAMPVVTMTGGGTGLSFRFTFVSTQLHSVELHNAIRVLGISGGRQHSGTWGEHTTAHPPGLLAQIQSYFVGLTEYTTGTPTTTIDFITLTPLAPSLDTAPTSNPDSSTTAENMVTTASSAHSTRPTLLFTSWVLAKIMRP